MKANYCILSKRGALRLTGRDVREFLQALITRDLDDLTAETAVYSALLTPQGKYLFDFFLAQQGNDILLDAEASRLSALTNRLNLYKLRADVTITPLEHCEISVIFGGDANLENTLGATKSFSSGVEFVDPRIAYAGARIIAPKGQVTKRLAGSGAVVVDASQYEYFRLGLALPESGRDLLAEKSLMLESNLDALNGVDFDKGCFVGQELTARTKYRSLVRKRLLPVDIDGPVPEPNKPLMAGKIEIATMRSGQGDRGIALVRLNRLADAGGLGIALTAGATTLTPKLPSWAEFDLLKVGK